MVSQYVVATRVWSRLIEKDEADDVLDIDLPLLRVRLLGQSCESFLEVFATSLGIARLAIIILKDVISAKPSNTTRRALHVRGRSS